MPMLNKVFERLISFGYEIPMVDDEYQPSAVDDMMLSFISEKECNYVKGECNTDEIPKEIEFKVVDHIVGEFLMSKKNLGQLDLANIDLSGAVKKLDLGDASIEFADGGSQTEMFGSFINYLMQPIDLSDYRRIRW